MSAVSAHDVFCLYPTPRGHVAALRGLTLDVAAGERVVVHGPNGSGKTTLLRVLAGEHAPSAGSVAVCGVDLMGARERDRSALRAYRLGRVDQHHARQLRPELSVVDNVALQLRVAGSRVARARTRAGDLLDRLGLGHLAGRRPVTLSGGEAQRVAVCAAVAHEPALVLADEPTGELDRDAADAVYDLLSDVAAACGAALVLVSHDTRATRVADRVVRIRDGRLSEEWTPAEAGNETLVVDDRGWVRLPEPLRVRSGVTTRVRAAAADQTIVLSPVGAAPARTDAVPQPGPAAYGPQIAELRGVTAQRDRRLVLDAQELRLRRGSLTAVRGPSGSGKTTLLRILAGLERPDAGSVLVAGVDLAGLDRSGLAALRRGQLSVAGQGIALVETLDVPGNLELVRQARGLPASSDLVDGWIAELGLTGVRHRAVRVLSGGERQRVAVARVLAVEPALAVLDEPTSQQDEANAERIAAVLLGAARGGMAVVAATHDPLLVAAADTVLTLG
ncbi:MAG TPA: ATP-binding cassette domain-containing protein [Micromonosporaceae bacterium]|nr:ATP-binding cassette domain-containing protein [Micromonosporaceae bacterium]